MEETLLVVGKRPELLTRPPFDESEEEESVPSSAFFPHWNDLVSMVELQNEGAAPKVVGEAAGAGAGGSAAGVGSGAGRVDADDEEDEVPEDPNEPPVPKPPVPKPPVPKPRDPKEPPDPKEPDPKDPDPNDPPDPNEDPVPREPKLGLLWSPEVKAKADEKADEVDLGSAASFCQPKEMVWVFAGDEDATVDEEATVEEAAVLSFLEGVSPPSSFLSATPSDCVFLSSSFFSSVDEEDPSLDCEI